MKDITRTLARKLVASRYADIPADVIHQAQRAVLNFLGCAVGGASHETVERVLSALGPFSGPPQAAILGRRERLDILHAALINGISSHVLDFDDTHARAIHPSAPVLPVLLAMAEWRPLSGAQLLHAFVLGVEAECRVGLSVFPEHYDAGWHITGTAGVFGAAAAAGKVLALDEQQMTWALGIAATQSCGLQEMFGSMCKSLHPGQAARGGLAAALLASRNFTSSGQAVEAPRGWARVLSTRFDPAVITEGWGERYELSSNMYKPYACGLVVHGVIDGCIELKREHALRLPDVERIELTVSPRVYTLTGIKTPRTGLEGKFSVYHAAAAAFVREAAGEAQFSDACVNDPAIAALRARIVLREDASIGRTGACVSITLKNGRTHTKLIEHALGTLQRPMSDADLEAKFRGLTEEALAPDQMAKVIDLCWKLNSAADAAALAYATVPQA